VVARQLALGCIHGLCPPCLSDTLTCVSDGTVLNRCVCVVCTCV